MSSDRTSITGRQLSNARRRRLAPALLIVVNRCLWPLRRSTLSPRQRLRLVCTVWGQRSSAGDVVSPWVGPPVGLSETVAASGRSPIFRGVRWELPYAGANWTP
jgi:hypothetical protein